MRILVTTRFYLNGQTTHVLTLCQELIRQNHEVFLVISGLDHPSYLLFLQEQRIPYSRTNEIMRLLPRLRVFEPDVIHSHSSHTLQSSLELGQALGIPVVATSHYLDFEPRCLLEQAQTVIAISKEMKEQLTLNKAPVVVVENGVPIPPCRSHPPHAKHAVFLARVSRSKQSNFQMAADSFKKHHWEISVVGNWRFPGVLYRGWRRDVFPELTRASLVVGTGRAIREGMAAGCAAIVLGEYYDGVVNQENVKELEYYNFSGRFSKTIPSPDQLETFLKELTPEYIQELGNFGRAYATQHFSIQKMAASLLKVYHSAKNERENRANVKYYTGGRK